MKTMAAAAASALLGCPPSQHPAGERCCLPALGGRRHQPGGALPPARKPAGGGSWAADRRPTGPNPAGSGGARQGARQGSGGQRKQAEEPPKDKNQQQGEQSRRANSQANLQTAAQGRGQLTANSRPSRFSGSGAKTNDNKSKNDNAPSRTNTRISPGSRRSCAPKWPSHSTEDNKQRAHRQQQNTTRSETERQSDAKRQRCASETGSHRGGQRGRRRDKETDRGAATRPKRQPAIQAASQPMRPASQPQTKTATTTPQNTHKASLKQGARPDLAVVPALVCSKPFLTCSCCLLRLGAGAAGSRWSWRWCLSWRVPSLVVRLCSLVGRAWALVPVLAVPCLRCALLPGWVGVGVGACPGGPLTSLRFPPWLGGWVLVLARALAFPCLSRALLRG